MLQYLSPLELIHDNKMALVVLLQCVCAEDVVLLLFNPKLMLSVRSGF